MALTLACPLVPLTFALALALALACVENCV